jgi:iron complex transport system substrate-binding protein
VKRRVALSRLVVASSFALLAVSSAQTKYPITLRHDLGETVIAKKPERVVVYAEEVAEIAHALGVRPVGYVSRRPANANLGAPVGEINSSIKATLKGATWLGLVNQPSLEGMVALKPDLILAFTSEGTYLRGDGGYANFSRIAPTLAYSFDANQDVTWADTLLEVGRALDLEPKAKSFLNEYAARFAALKKAFAPIVERSRRVTLLFMPNPNATFVLGPKHPFALVMTKLGFRLTLPSGATISNGSSAPMNTEGLALEPTTKRGRPASTQVPPQNRVLWFLAFQRSQSKASHDQGHPKLKSICWTACPRFVVGS